MLNRIVAEGMQVMAGSNQECAYCERPRSLVQCRRCGAWMCASCQAVMGRQHESGECVRLEADAEPVEEACVSCGEVKPEMGKCPWCQRRVCRDDAKAHCYTCEQEGRAKATVASDPSPRRSVCLEAHALVTGDRRVDYGDLKSSFGRVAELWSVILGVEVTSSQVALCMIAFKLARLCNAYKRDSAIDLCGYSECLAELEEGGGG